MAQLGQHLVQEGMAAFSAATSGSAEDVDMGKGALINSDVATVQGCCTETADKLRASG